MAAIRVLLVEDSPTYAQLVRSMLSVAKATQFEVIHVGSAEDALGSISDGTLDAILLDLMLPDSSGLDTLQRINQAAQGIPVLVLTSVDDEQTSLRALHKGAADYLIKSEVSANWLTRAIAYSIERQRVGALAAEQDDESKARPLLAIEWADSDNGVVTARFTERRLVSVVALERVKLRLFSLLKQRGMQQLRLDFSEVEYVANAAISTLLLVHKKAASQNCRMVLQNVSPAVREHFATRRFDRVFQINESG